MPRLLLVRHGQTELSEEPRFWGQTDIALSEHGVAQAQRLRERLRPVKFAAVYASDLKRTVTTAKIILGKRKTEITPCAELREVSFGQLEGLTFDEIGKLYPDLVADLEMWRVSPRFPGGESIPELDARLERFLPRLDAHAEGGTVLVVAHGGSLRRLLCHLMQLENEHWNQLRIDLASLSILDVFPEAELAVLSLLNDTSHLAITGGLS
ncbi:histidine phosphatase family protein [Chloroflexota bacterium]